MTGLGAPIAPAHDADHIVLLRGVIVVHQGTTTVALKEGMRVILLFRLEEIESALYNHQKQCTSAHQNPQIKSKKIQT